MVSFTAQQIALLIQGKIEGEATAVVKQFGKIESAMPGEISKKLITVSDLLRFNQLASPAKIHLTFKRLIKKKMINLGTNPEDERIRYVKPSIVGLRRLEKLNHMCQ
jgi:hypothetical protein